jgi:hypothetical protein
MDHFCPVCNEKINLGEPWLMYEVDGFEIHDKDCILKYRENPEKYGGKAREPDNESIERLQKAKENKQKIENKSVYVKGFSMPFGEMVIFALKWMLAMIPALILFWTIMAIFTAIFGISWLSIF